MAAVLVPFGCRADALVPVVARTAAEVGITSAGVLSGSPAHAGLALSVIGADPERERKLPLGGMQLAGFAHEVAAMGKLLEPALHAFLKSTEPQLHPDCRGHALPMTAAARRTGPDAEVRAMLERLRKAAPRVCPAFEAGRLLARYTLTGAIALEIAA